LPDKIKFYYNNEAMKLSMDAEEVMTFYAKMLDHDYTKKDAFNTNFFNDWRKVIFFLMNFISLRLKFTLHLFEFSS